MPVAELLCITLLPRLACGDASCDLWAESLLDFCVVCLCYTLSIWAWRNAWHQGTKSAGDSFWICSCIMGVFFPFCSGCKGNTITEGGITREHVFYWGEKEYTNTAGFDFIHLFLALGVCYPAQRSLFMSVMFQSEILAFYPMFFYLVGTEASQTSLHSSCLLYISCVRSC